MCLPAVVHKSMYALRRNLCISWSKQIQRFFLLVVLIKCTEIEQTSLKGEEREGEEGLMEGGGKLFRKSTTASMLKALNWWWGALYFGNGSLTYRHWTLLFSLWSRNDEEIWRRFYLIILITNQTIYMQAYSGTGAAGIGAACWGVDIFFGVPSSPCSLFFAHDFLHSMINSLLGFVLVSSNRSKSDPTGGGFVPLNTHLDTHVSNFFADFESSSALATESFTGLETVGDGDNGSSIVENSTAEARTLDNRCDGAAFKAVVSIAFALLVIRLLLRPSILSTLIKQTRKRSCIVWLLLILILQ